MAPKSRPLSEEDKIAASNLREVWALRKNLLGLTQEKAAEQLGYATQSAVSQYLRGDIALNTEAVLKFAKLLRVSPGMIDPRVSDLLSGMVNWTDQPTPDQPHPDLAALLPLASPRSRSALERIAEAAREGRLSEADMELLGQIAARIAERAR